MGLLTAWNSQKEYGKAVPAAEFLVKAAPSDLDARSALAIAYDGIERRDDAIREYQRILDVNAANPLIWGNLGWTQYNAGKYSDALASSKKALAIDSSLAYVRFNLGLIYAVLGDSANSKKEYAEALKKCLPPELKAGIDDLKDALHKKPNSSTVKEALQQLEKH